MNKQEKFKSAAKSRAELLAEEYKRAHDIKGEDGRPGRDMHPFVVRIGEPKHTWAADACRDDLQEIDKRIKGLGYEYRDARGSSTRFGRGYYVARFMDTFTGYEDQVTKTLHVDFFDYYLRIAWLVRSDASHEDIIKNEKLQATSVQPFLGEELTQHLIDWATYAKDSEVDTGNRGPILTFRTTDLLKGKIRVGVKQTADQVWSTIPSIYQEIVEDASIRLFVGCFIEMMMLSIDYEGRNKYPKASEWASEFLDYFRTYLFHYRVEYDFDPPTAGVRKGSSSENLDLFAS